MLSFKMLLVDEQQRYIQVGRWFDVDIMVMLRINCVLAKFL